MHKPLLFALALLGSGPALAAELDITVDIPPLEVAKYRRPYVAIWLENASEDHLINLAVWHDLTKPEQPNRKWLKSLRRWWHVDGWEQKLPIDGVSGATRAAGRHHLHCNIRGIRPGQYFLVVEAAREHGGRELLRLPFAWPASETVPSIQGESELGEVQLQITP